MFRWYELLIRCPESLPFHSIAWRNGLAHGLKQLDSVYFFIREDDRIVGALPAFIFEPVPGVRMLHSMPWNLFGGIQIVSDASVNLTELFQAVEIHLNSLARKHRVCETVITLPPSQTGVYGQKLLEIGYERRFTLFTHLLKIQPDYEQVYSTYKKSAREAIRQADRTGIVVQDTDEEIELERFYEIYLITQQRLCSTPKPLSMIRFLFKSNLAKLAVAKYEDRIVSGLLYLFFNQTVTLWCIGSLPQFWKHRPNNAIYHHIIRWACESGYKWVDFGASPPENQGLVAHKEQHGAKQFDFSSYSKVHSPIRRFVWQRLEPALRKIYTGIQQARSQLPLGNKL